MPMTVLQHRGDTIQVCVPESSSDAEVENFANQLEYLTFESPGKWTVCRPDDPVLMGAGPRVVCLDCPGHVHVVLRCRTAFMPGRLSDSDSSSGLVL